MLKLNVKFVISKLKINSILFLLLSMSGSVAAASFNHHESACLNNTVFNVGAGVYDITGPAAEEGMMGYAMLQQQTAGILQRLWARAFVIESPCNGERIVLVNTDLGMVFQAVKQQVIMKLKTRYGDRYTDGNVLITATHQHSGPGGFSTYPLYNLTTLGFDRKNFTTIVDGIVGAISRAEVNMTAAHIRIATHELKGINFNRSPTAYLQNPLNERNQYAADTDQQMILLRFDSLAGKPIGMINWFPIHGVSMNNKNHLINGDNKGYAEYLFEKDFSSDYGQTAFVAAFAQSNAGDVSPNELGHEGGSGAQGIEAIEKAGGSQYRMAKKIYAEADELVRGGVDYRHRSIAMNDVTIDPQYTQGQIEHTCPPAIGVSMLAGTQDGEGIGRQGVTCHNISHLLPPVVCALITTPCQGVKPIALETTGLLPRAWTPTILPLQVIKLGNVVIAAAPFELTTMTGRRIQKTITANLPDNEKYSVVLSALSNAYSGYVATPEEYQLQRYEGASTHFGPWTAAALQQEYAQLTQALMIGVDVEAGPTPPDLFRHMVNLQPRVVMDAVPLSKHFGDVEKEVFKVYHAGEQVEVTFWGGHPRNNFRINQSFLAIQHWEANKWVTIRTDRDWDTEYHWQRRAIAYSEIKIVWRIPQDTLPGRYRILHFGEWKGGLRGRIHSYMGYSSDFNIV